jgi:RNA polymerase sigma factor (sigma-70 family)
MGTRVVPEPQPRWGPAHGDGTVYVVDDDDGICRALCRLLASVGLRAEVFPSAEAFLSRARPDPPSCLVLDLYLGKGHSGLDLQAQLDEQRHTIPIIFITGTNDVRASVLAMKAGAFDFLEKPVDHETLLASVRAALTLSRQRAVAQAERKVVESRLAQLTPRERQVLQLVVRGGLSNRQIAAELGAAERTIKAHRGRVTRKMQAASVADLVRMIQCLRVDPVRSWFGDDAAVAQRNLNEGALRAANERPGGHWEKRR